MTYGYARVSSTDQNLERQLQQLREYTTDDRYIICDKQSGKNFDRKGYNLLVGTDTTAPMLHEGDLLIVTSLDRLGRNYTEIKKQWEYITNTLKVDIKVLDMPLLDTSQSINTLDKRFICDLVLQILSYTAEKERENINKRQEQGIDAMPIVDGKKVSLKTGRATGRPNIKYPDNWDDVFNQWQSDKITAIGAMAQLNLKRNTFYRLASRYKNN